MFDRTQLPRITGDVRLAYEVTVSTLPWRSNASSSSLPGKRVRASSQPVAMSSGRLARVAAVATFTLSAIAVSSAYSTDVIS